MSPTNANAKNSQTTISKESSRTVFRCTQSVGGIYSYRWWVRQAQMRWEITHKCPLHRRKLSRADILGQMTELLLFRWPNLATTRSVTFWKLCEVRWEWERKSWWVSDWETQRGRLKREKRADDRRIVWNNVKQIEPFKYNKFSNLIGNIWSTATF